MKQRLIFLNVLLASCLAGVIGLALGHCKPWLIMGVGSLALLLLALTLHAWLKYLAQLALQSAKDLNLPVEENSGFSFQWLDVLQANHQRTVTKLKVAAESIGNLSRQETTTTHDLLKNDPIGTALNNIRQEMLQLKEEEGRRSWIAQGLARFSEILRNKAEVKEYTHQIISNLVKYLGANQGALFIAYTN